MCDMCDPKPALGRSHGLPPRTTTKKGHVGHAGRPALHALPVDEWEVAPPPRLGALARPDCEAAEVASGCRLGTSGTVLTESGSSAASVAREGARGLEDVGQTCFGSASETAWECVRACNTGGRSVCGTCANLNLVRL